MQIREQSPSGMSTYSSAMGDAINYTRWILDAFHDLIGRRVVEIGVGHGTYLDQLPRLEEYVGIDIDADAVDAARRSHPGVNYLQADIMDASLADRIKGRRIDTVLCFNVLEHIADDRGAIVNLMRLLEPGGHLLLFVPAFGFLYSDLDRIAGHHRRYRRRSLADIVPRQLGRIVRNEYFNPVGGLGWWANKFLPHKSLDDRAVCDQVRLFDRYILPLSRLVNPLTCTVFGQSIVCAVRKL